MIKIIDDLIYDTEKSELVIEFRRMSEVLYFFRKVNMWVEGELYKTKNGRWFEVVGIGLSNPQLNALSEYEAKEIIKEADPCLYVNMFDNVEEA